MILGCLIHLFCLNIQYQLLHKIRILLHETNRKIDRAMFWHEKQMGLLSLFFVFIWLERELIWFLIVLIVFVTDLWGMKGVWKKLSLFFAWKKMYGCKRQTYIRDYFSFHLQCCQSNCMSKTDFPCFQPILLIKNNKRNNSEMVTPRKLHILHLFLL